MTKCRTEPAAPTSPRRAEAGFTLIELLMVMAIGAILAGIAVPTLRMGDRVRVDKATRAIQQELQAARLRAVSVNRQLEVRFNCPSAGQYRIVESGFTSSARCDPIAFPYPPPPNAAYRVPRLPRYDGPVRYLDDRVTLSTSSSGLVLQFSPNGRATKLEGSVSKAIGTESVTLSIDSYSSTIDVNTLGKAVIR